MIQFGHRPESGWCFVPTAETLPPRRGRRTTSRRRRTLAVEDCFLQVGIAQAVALFGSERLTSGSVCFRRHAQRGVHGDGDRDSGHHLPGQVRWDRLLVLEWVRQAGAAVPSTALLREYHGALSRLLAGDSSGTRDGSCVPRWRAMWIGFRANRFRVRSAAPAQNTAACRRDRRRRHRRRASGTPDSASESFGHVAAGRAGRGSAAEFATVQYLACVPEPPGGNVSTTRR